MRTITLRVAEELSHVVAFWTLIAGIAFYGLLASVEFEIARLLPKPKPPERRCTVCNYELTRNISGRCPECRMVCEMDPTCRELRPQIREARLLHARRKRKMTAANNLPE